MFDVFPTAAQPTDIANSVPAAPTIEIFVNSPGTVAGSFHGEGKSIAGSFGSHTSFAGSQDGCYDSPAIFKIASPSGGSLVKQISLPRDAADTCCATFIPFSYSLRSSASNNASIAAPQHVVLPQPGATEEQTPDGISEGLVHPEAVYVRVGLDTNDDVTDDSELHEDSPEPELCYARPIHGKPVKATILMQEEFEDPSDGDTEYETFRNVDSDGIERSSSSGWGNMIKRSSNPCFLEMISDDEHL